MIQQQYQYSVPHTDCCNIASKLRSIYNNFLISCSTDTKQNSLKRMLNKLYQFAAAIQLLYKARTTAHLVHRWAETRSMLQNTLNPMLLALKLRGCFENFYIEQWPPNSSQLLPSVRITCSQQKVFGMPDMLFGMEPQKYRCTDMGMRLDSQNNIVMSKSLVEFQTTRHTEKC
jgi:hypothetical protein